MLGLVDLIVLSQCCDRLNNCAHGQAMPPWTVAVSFSVHTLRHARAPGFRVIQAILSRPWPLRFNLYLPLSCRTCFGLAACIVYRLSTDLPGCIACLLQGLRACESIFGADTNPKGYKVLRGVGVIQGDGINITTLAAILDAVLAAGYSAQNVAFGMGGGLLQKVNRDTMSFATKLSHVVFKDGRAADVMKLPKTDIGKFSLPGEGGGGVSDRGE